MPSPVPAKKAANLSQSALYPSSLGNASAVVTPKDVDPGDASAHDITVRNVTSENLEVRQEALLDDAIELTFPASDPIAIPSYDLARAKRHAKQRKPV